MRIYLFGLCSVFFCFMVSSASALEAVLIERKGAARIEIAPIAGAEFKDQYIVTWDKLGAEASQGAMIYAKTKDSSESRYFAVGGEGPFAIVDSGWSVQVIDGDLKNPRQMRVEKEKPDRKSLLAAYRKAQGIADVADDKKVIQEAVDQAVVSFNSNCGAKASATLQWEQFEKQQQLALAKEASAVISGIGSACSEAEYKKEIGKISSFSFGYDHSGQKMDFKKSGNKIDAKLVRVERNPRDQSRAWILKEL
ncbi:MAG: hypothetical protein AB7O96_10505 [Pseudobdellovibrionaceae bacterium]